jgi:hypothetical protein
MDDEAHVSFGWILFVFEELDVEEAILPWFIVVAELLAAVVEGGAACDGSSVMLQQSQLSIILFMFKISVEFL